MDPPTRELSQQLAALGLATALDLRRCSSRVKKLAGGLPATDSVWIDALVLATKLTPFQAQRLENGRTSDLLIGRKYVLQSPLHRDPLLSVFQAYEPARNTKLLISQMTCPSQEGDAASLRMLKSIKALSSGRDLLPAVPFDAILERNSLFLVAPMQIGASLASLLIRRGRFSEPIVRAIAVEVIKQLQVSENWVIHGDLRPANLWLTQQGELQLLNWGLLDAVSPTINIHSQLPLDAYDGIAPERFDGNVRATAAADIYSLGCTLWQLLTGRPPFPVADPLAKLTAHRMRQVPDVRTLAPDVSESFAALLRKMTSREVHRRLQNSNEVRAALGAVSTRNRPRLHRFITQFESAAPRQISTERPPSRIPALAGAVLLTLGLTATAWNRDQLGWPQIMRVSASTSQKDSGKPGMKKTAEFTASSGLRPDFSSDVSITADTSLASEGADAISAVLPAVAVPAPTLPPIPGPSLDGLVELGPGEKYGGTEVIAGETLTLRGDSLKLAEIRIGNGPLVLEADHLRLENIHFIIEDEGEHSASAGMSPVQIRAQTLSISRCTVEWKRPPARKSLIQWSAPAGSSGIVGRLLVHESTLITPANLFQMEIPLGAALFENVLRVGNGALVDLPQGVGAALRAPLILNRCTLRECGPLVRLPKGEVLEKSGRLSIQGAESLIDLSRGAPLVESAAGALPVGWESHVEVAAQGLVVEVGARLAGFRPADSENYNEISAEAISVDGLLSGDFHFENGPAAQKGSSQLVIDSLPVRLSSRDPGANLSRLPDFPLAEKTESPMP